MTSDAPVSLKKIAAVQARYLVGATRRLPFAADSFDLILSPSTLDHFPDSDDLGVSLKEIAWVFAPAGRLIITLDNPQNIFDPLLRSLTGLDGRHSTLGARTPYLISGRRLNCRVSRWRKQLPGNCDGHR